MEKFFKNGRALFTKPQSTIFSAATLIMVMVLASKFLGFIKQRVLFHFFPPETTDLFFAAFEIPDVLFEVFIYGVLSASFIPVFTKYLAKDKKKEAFHMANATLTLLVGLFLALAVLLFIFASPLYELIAGDSLKSLIGLSGGFSEDQISEVVTLARIILGAQFFFALSTFLTGVLESYKRFLVPAIAPLFYNLGIIFGTVLLSNKVGLLGPAIGAVAGAFAHFAIQLPLAKHLGFRYKMLFDIKHEGVKKIMSLSAPRVFELSFFQLRRVAWLFLASLVGGGFTYLKSADLLQALPVGLFGTAIAKAALPTLSGHAGRNDTARFSQTLTTGLRQILFFVIPASVFLAILRIPIVRLVFGGNQFDWEATVQTGHVLTAFSIGLFAYAGSLLVTRGFYARQNTKTPVTISVVSSLLGILLAFWLVIGKGVDTWGIALSFSIAGVLQFSVLTFLLLKEIGGGYWQVLRSFLKLLVASFVSGGAMFMLLKVFDRSVWVKRLSFLGAIESTKFIPFETFVLDTTYTINLVILTVSVLVIGSLLYLGTTFVLRVQETYVFFGIIGKIFTKGKTFLSLEKNTETVAPPPTDVEP